MARDMTWISQTVWANVSQQSFLYRKKKPVKANNMSRDRKPEKNARGERKLFVAQWDIRKKQKKLFRLWKGL